MSVYVEIRQDDNIVAGAKIYVLRVGSIQHQVQRRPTIVELPGDPEPGESQIMGYDIGITVESISLNGDVTNADEAVGSTDPAYEAALTKTYPGKTSLREAALTWWADANWAEKTGMIELHTPLGEIYMGVVQEVQFQLSPGRDLYEFSLSFRILDAKGTAALTTSLSQS